MNETSRPDTEKRQIKLKKLTKRINDDSILWASAICFDAQSTSVVLRDILQRNKIDFKRESSEKSYSQLYAIVPYPRVAYVFRFRILSPAPLTIDLYDTHPATSGALSFIEIPDLRDENIELARRILKALSGALPRPPWRFTIWQRVQHGLLNPDLLRAKKNWQTLGIAH